jgi:hypothetical protein
MARGIPRKSHILQTAFHLQCPLQWICIAMVDYRMALAMLLHVTRLFLRACPLQVLLWFAPLIDHRLPASN